MSKKKSYMDSNNILSENLTSGLDQDNNIISTKIIKEGALTIFLNKQEIVTLMCILDHPIYLAIGYLLNQNMIGKKDKIRSIDFDKDLNLIVVRTNKKTNYEKMLKKVFDRKIPWGRKVSDISTINY